MVVLAGAALAFSIGQTIVIPVLPTIQREYGVDASDATWTITVFLITASLATPIAGRLGDMRGKDRWLLISLGLFAVGSVLCAIADSFGLLIAGRALTGTAGGIVPLAIGIIRDELPPERVAIGIGLVSSTLGVGGGIGLVASGLIVDHAAFSLIFWICVPAAALAAGACYRFVPRSPVLVAARIDWGGAGLLCLSLLALMILISRGNAWGWTSSRALILAATASVLGLLWARWESRVQEPMVDLREMRERGVWTANALALIAGFAMFASVLLIPQLAQIPLTAGYGFGASNAGAALFLLPQMVVMLFAGAGSGVLAVRYGRRSPLLVGALAALAAYAWLAFEHSAPFHVYAASALLGIGVGCTLSAVANLVVESVAPDRTSVAVAVNNLMRTVGGAIGAQAAAAILAVDLGGGVVPAEAGFEAAFLVSAAAAAAALLLVATVPGGAVEPERAFARPRGW
jgi:EmrB/QacA subfamily drug resistance transporter